LPPAFDQVIAEKIASLFGTSTQVHAIQPLAGDASSRRYYRTKLSGAAAPNSVIIMELPAGSALPLSSEELAIFKEPPKELPFLNVHRFLAQVGVRVPRLHGHWEKDNILILEDLGDVALWDHVQALGPAEVLHWYRRAIDELLLLQIRGTQARDDDCIAFQQRFDFRLYMWEFNHFLEYGLEKRPGTRVSRNLLEQLRAVFIEMAQQLDCQTPCLNHRDYHSWNLMIHEGAIAVIDFQDALLAPPQYDLASLLNDRETDRIIGPDLEHQLIQYYLGRREEMGEPKTDPHEFFEIYLLTVIQRDLKVVGRFYYLDVVKGKSGYRKFIPPTVKRLRRNLSRAPQLQAIIPLLAEHYEEMR
jgi:aminoglycoside/choline kinase family phosphotransferase